MKERAAPLRDGSPQTECMSDWLLSSQFSLNSLHRRALPQACRGQTRNKGFPNNSKSQIGVLRILSHYIAYSCSSSNFKLLFPPPCQLNLFSCGRGAEKVQSFWLAKTRRRGRCYFVPIRTSRSRKGWTSLRTSRVKRQGWKSCKESSPCAFKPGSAFAKVHFCISEHTNPSACSNSLQLSLRQLMTTAQQQHCLISNVFLNLGCQGSLVGGCLLYFSYKKVFFSLRQWLIQRPRRREDCRQ